MGNGYFSKAKENSAKALKHIIYCDNIYCDDTKESVHRSLILDNNIHNTDTLNKFLSYYLSNHNINPTPNVVFKSYDTVSSIYDQDFQNLKFTILNFASFKNPGGMFIKGSSAQEECLCHESNLYSVLRDIDNTTRYYSDNRSNTNKSMYFDRAIFSPNIIFERNETCRYADVITCAAPNFTSGFMHGISGEENLTYMEQRIKFLFESLIYAYAVNNDSNDRALVLGAWGCGVFGQDPYKVSQLFKKYIDLGYADRFKKIIFAILPGRNFDEFIKGYNSNNI